MALNSQLRQELCFTAGGLAACPSGSCRVVQLKLVAEPHGGSLGPRLLGPPESPAQQDLVAECASNTAPGGAGAAGLGRAPQEPRCRPKIADWALKT